MIAVESSFTTRTADELIATANLLCCNVSQSESSIKVCALASTFPTCVCTDTADAQGDEVTVHLLCGGGVTYQCVAAGAIAPGVPVYTAPSGKVQVLPTSPGTYYFLGYSLSTAAANNSPVRCVLGIPQKIIIEAQP